MMSENKLYDLMEEIRKMAIETLPLGTLTNEDLEDRVESLFACKTDGDYIPIEQRIAAVTGIVSSIRGLGILDGLIADEDVTEIMVNGSKHIFIEKAGKIQPTDLCFDSQKRLEDVIQRIVGKAGREVNQANPIVDARLSDGSRVSVVLPPVSLCGPVLTIRKFSTMPLTMERLIALGSISEEAAGKLRMLVKAKYNLFISGGTGSGKTTFLNALAGFIPRDERIITIEDSAELRLQGIENLIGMETRNANSSGAGRIAMRDLIRASLRMRPERIIVGEVRGEEALDMLQAMNTGHDGSLSTGHANSTRDMLFRLETMVLTGAAGLPQDAVRRQIASAIDIVIHLSRLRDHSRRVVEITELVGYRDGEIQLNPLFMFDEMADNGGNDSMVGQLMRTKNPFINDNKLQRYGIDGYI